MPSASYTFPAGFLWGTATAAFQVEGHNAHSNWTAWVDEPGRIIQGMKPGLACDWWGGRWKEDLDRAVETGQNAHRLSVDWARIQPAPDRWDEDALDAYRQILRGVVERGLTPMVTLHHFVDPLWFYEQGGWVHPDAPRQFIAFVRKTVEALQEYATLWVTINEPNIYYFDGYFSGKFPPGKKGDLTSIYTVLCNMVRGHAGAYRAIHEIQKLARVGIAHHHRPLIPMRSWLPFDSLLASLAQTTMNAFPEALDQGRINILWKRTRIPEAAHTMDFIGLNYYSTSEVGFNLDPARQFHDQHYPAGADLSDTGFLANIPSGMFEAIKWGHRFHLPILITENGIEDANDALRPRYMIQHLHQVWKAINYNWQVNGYFHWTLVDNFEWERGWSQRFGLWGLDPETQARQRRTSVDVYAEICRTNSISSEMVQKYAPSLMETLFPG